jgi:hypothetical protein
MPDLHNHKVVGRRVLQCLQRKLRQSSDHQNNVARKLQQRSYDLVEFNLDEKASAFQSADQCDFSNPRPNYTLPRISSHIPIQTRNNSKALARIKTDSALTWSFGSPSRCCNSNSDDKEPSESQLQTFDVLSSLFSVVDVMSKDRLDIKMPDHLIPSR